VALSLVSPVNYGEVVAAVNCASPWRVQLPSMWRGGHGAHQDG